MQEIKKALSLPRLKYYETHLSLINCILPIKMTPMEIEVLASFMNLEGEVAQYRFGTTARKIVMKNLNLSPGGLSNYITSLTNKNFLTKVEGIFKIQPILIPEDSEQQYRFRLVNNNETEVNNQNQLIHEQQNTNNYILT